MKSSSPSKETLSPKEMRRKKSLRIRELCVFAMLGALMFASKLALEWATNIHLLGVFTMTFTIVYRAKALIPIYVFVAIGFVYYGFAPWYVLHFYVWLVLWGVTMLIPRRLPKALLAVLYPVVCGLHGLSYGALCALSQVPIYYHSWDPAVFASYIVYGFPYDVIHAIGNTALGLFILPLSTLLQRLERSRR